MHLVHRDNEVVIAVDTAQPFAPVERVYLQQFDGVVVEFKDDELSVKHNNILSMHEDDVSAIEPHRSDTPSMLDDILLIESNIFEMYRNVRKGSHEHLARFNRFLDDVIELMDAYRNA